MASPLAEFYNTILIIPSAETMGEDEAGNPKLMSGVDQEYKAYTKKLRDPQANYSPGTDSLKQYCAGYVVDPTALPPGLNLPATVKAKKRRGQAGQWIEGTFEILPVFTPIDVVEDVLGDAITGYFRIAK